MLLQRGLLREEDVMPDISPFIFYVDAYREISTCRNGLSSSLPFTAIIEYAKVYNIEDFDEFLYLMRAMDEETQSLEKREKDGRK